MGKDPYDIGEQNNVVYEISCNCGKCYVLSKSESVKFSLIHQWKNIFHC